MPVDKFGRMSDTKTKDSGVSLTYINNNYIRSDGNSRITGNLDMGGSTIENLGEPKKPKDATTKEYVDDTTADNITNQIKQLNQLVSVSASYHGDLIKDEYQFAFGGPSSSTNKILQKYNGFLVPTFGVIKHFLVKPNGLRVSVKFSDDKLFKALIDNYGLKDRPTPIYTLVLIKGNDRETIDIGTMFFLF